MRELPLKRGPRLEVDGLFIDFKHRVMPDRSDSRGRKFEVEYVVCFPPGS